MSEIVNLRIARKRAVRDQAERAAADQRLAHGTSKAQRSLAQARQSKAARDHEHHRINTGDNQ
jgi:hypothetical protein